MSDDTTSQNGDGKTSPLTLEALKAAVQTAAAFRCRRTLQPGGGPGTKVFPPTYAGAVYAVERRRIPKSDGSGFESLPCVLLDSVQSQANRMEEALQDAVDAGELEVPLIEVDFRKYYGAEQDDDLPGDQRLLEPLGTLTSLQAPHRLADALLRDCVLVNEKGDRTEQRFRDSKHAKRWRGATARFATPIFELCPTALVFGMWGSPDKPGGLGAKFERAMVSEIVGVNAAFGVRTSSRIDPAGIQRGAGPVYRTPDGGWTTDPEKALKGKNHPILFAKTSKGADIEHDPNSTKLPDQGRPSTVNHGNVTPAFGKYADGAEGPDVLKAPELLFDYRLASSDGTLDHRERFEAAWPDARKGQIAPGGVTVDYAEQTSTLSLICLRRLRFPKPDGTNSSGRDNAARTVLAALGLCAATLAAESGLDLRSRCLLWPDGPMEWELLDTPGATPRKFVLDRTGALQLLKDAIGAATSQEVGLSWPTTPIKLEPSDELLRLVVRSQELSARGELEEASEGAS